MQGFFSLPVYQVQLLPLGRNNRETGRHPRRLNGWVSDAPCL
jgi:hypothetical protein